MTTPIPSQTHSWTTNLNGISSLTLQHTPTPDPHTLPPNHILVRILSVSLNYKDAEIINGLFRHHKSSVAPADLVPCADSVGVIVAVGPTTISDPDTASTRPTPTWEVGAHVLSVSYPDYLTGAARPAYLAAGVGSAVNGVLTTHRVFPSHGVVACPASLISEPDLACCLPVAGTTAWMGLNWWRPLETITTSTPQEAERTREAVQRRQKPAIESRSAETVLLQGTGGVSMFGLLFARHMGMRTILTSSSEVKLSRARDLGADERVNYRTHPDWDEEVLRVTEGEGVDIIFENGGGGPPATNSTVRSFRCVKFGGIVNAIGYVGGKMDLLAEGTDAPVNVESGSRGNSGGTGTEIARNETARRIERHQQARTNINVLALSRNITIKGLLNGPRDRMEEMLRFVERHKIKPVVDRVFAFEEAREALQYLWDGKHFGKVVIRVASA